ncbi:hypothetical protein GBA52_025817 [Prunus armeniaca]|nr:hypothetical protein GBA52_025817 [Prunus armeniaca]
MQGFLAISSSLSLLPSPSTLPPVPAAPLACCLRMRRAESKDWINELPDCILWLPPWYHVHGGVLDCSQY